MAKITLIDFLNERNILECFVENIAKHSSYPEMKMQRLIEDRLSISSAFTWNSTLEGNYYWSELNYGYNKLRNE